MRFLHAGGPANGIGAPAGRAGYSSRHSRCSIPPARVPCPNDHRTEHDFLGEKQIPSQRLLGRAHGARGGELSPISGTPVSAMPELVRALRLREEGHRPLQPAELGVLDETGPTPSWLACEELIAGEHHEQFVVDVIQGGAGTSTNMNANEVIANLALERMGFEKGRYDVLHPNDHVNASQSTNDVYPTAVRLALWFGIDNLLESMAFLRAGFEAKAWSSSRC
jgi:aspartate ammonia-lyase